MTFDFINDNFLLGNKIAQEIYHSCVKALPVVDYHNHLSVEDLASDRKWKDIGELWVASDPYKHRAMRLAGVDEKYISGDASTREKFDAWCKVFQKTAGGPLFHWSCYELKNVFGIDLMPSEETADEIWEKCNALLAKPEFSTLAIMKFWNCKRLTTSNDLLEDISLHPQASAKAESIEITPSLRADSIISFNSTWIAKLGEGISSLGDYLDAVALRLDAFDKSECRLSDHALDNGFSFVLCSSEDAEAIFAKLLSKQEICEEESVKLKSFVLMYLGREYAKRGWVMQLHIGAERFTSSRLRKLAGGAGGYASIGHTCDIKSVCAFLDSLDVEGTLPKTILYTLNPADNAALATLTGSFSEDGVQGKVMYGPAWWYNDHKYGIEEQLKSLSSYSLLPTFIGMTTDSRNILSFCRHDYFRRVLCNYLGELAQRGELPSDIDWLGRLASDIAYNNAENWVYGK